MGYTPTEWKAGDVITAEKLNNMESGIGVLYINITSTDYSTMQFTTDKTFNEIKDGYDSGKMLLLILPPAPGPEGYGSAILLFAHVEKDSETDNITGFTFTHIAVTSSMILSMSGTINAEGPNTITSVSFAK